MDYDFDESLVGEAPCEFCGDLYPLMLLIEHQTTHLGGAEENFQLYDDFFDTQEGQNIITEEIAAIRSDPHLAEQKQASPVEDKPHVAFEQKQTSPVKDKVEPAPEKSSPIKNEERTYTTNSSPIKNEQKETKKVEIQKMKEFTTESGEKLLVYGTDIDSDKDLENEKQMFKMPNNPLLSSVCKEEDVEDINNLSDDDCNESIEEFWKRARDSLKRNRVKTEY